MISAYTSILFKIFKLFGIGVVLNRTVLRHYKILFALTILINLILL